jgi:hypothetical protein
LDDRLSNQHNIYFFYPRPTAGLSRRRESLTNDVQRWGPWAGKIITGAQHLTNSPPLKEGKLFFVQWDNATTNFVTRRISIDGFFEHVTFAPVILPNL